MEFLETIIREQNEKISQLTAVLGKFLNILNTGYTLKGKPTMPPLKEGSLYQRPDGRWEARLMINGKQKYIAISGNQETVYKKLKQAITEKHKAKNPKVKTFTLFSWLDHWHKVYRMPKKGKELSNNTIIMDLSMIRKIKKLFKDVELKDLTADVVQQKLNSMTQGRTCEGVYTVLKLALDKAKDRTGSISIMSLVEKVRYQRIRGRALSKDEVKKLLDAAKNETERDIIKFYVYTGCRVSEITSVLVEHINLKNNEIYIDGTKTKLSKRTLPMVPALRPIMEKLVENRHGDENLFNYTVPMIRYFHKTIKAKSKVKFALKDYRHTAATNFKDAGIPSSVYFRWFGWADDTMARKVYTHETDYEKRISQEWAEKFEG